MACLTTPSAIPTEHQLVDDCRDASVPTCNLPVLAHELERILRFEHLQKDPALVARAKFVAPSDTSHPFSDSREGTAWYSADDLASFGAIQGLQVSREKILRTAQHVPHVRVDFDKGLLGVDLTPRRTTVIIRDLPEDVGVEELRDVMEKFPQFSNDGERPVGDPTELTGELDNSQVGAVLESTAAGRDESEGASAPRCPRIVEIWRDAGRWFVSLNDETATVEFATWLQRTNCRGLPLKVRVKPDVVSRDPACLLFANGATQRSLGHSFHSTHAMPPHVAPPGANGASFQHPLPADASLPPVVPPNEGAGDAAEESPVTGPGADAGLISFVPQYVAAPTSEALPAAAAYAVAPCTLPCCAVDPINHAWVPQWQGYEPTYPAYCDPQPYCFNGARESEAASWHKCDWCGDTPGAVGSDQRGTYTTPKNGGRRPYGGRRGGGRVRREVAKRPNGGDYAPELKGNGESARTARRHADEGPLNQISDFPPLGSEESLNISSDTPKDRDRRHIMTPKKLSSPPAAGFAADASVRDAPVKRRGGRSRGEDLCSRRVPGSCQGQPPMRSRARREITMRDIISDTSGMVVRVKKSMGRGGGVSSNSLTTAGDCDGDETASTTQGTDDITETSPSTDEVTEVISNVEVAAVCV